MPDVEVQVDETWWPGELRMWVQAEDESWSAQVQWHGPDGTRIGAFDSIYVRADARDSAAVRER